MDFKETYKKYLEGTATDEEKTFVETEIERAKLVNNEIISNAKAEEAKPADNSTQKKKKRLRQTIKTIIISVVVFLIISIVAFFTVYNISVSKAVKNINMEPEFAKEAALEYAFMYARDHYGYSDSMEKIVSEPDSDSRELVFKFPLSKCYYEYEFEFIIGNREFDVRVNSSTGMPYLQDIDKLD